MSQCETSFDQFVLFINANMVEILCSNTQRWRLYLCVCRRRLANYHCNLLISISSYSHCGFDLFSMFILFVIFRLVLLTHSDPWINVHISFGFCNWINNWILTKWNSIINIFKAQTPLHKQYTKYTSIGCTYTTERYNDPAGKFNQILQRKT